MPKRARSVAAIDTCSNGVETTAPAPHHRPGDDRRHAEAELAEARVGVRLAAARTWS